MFPKNDGQRDSADLRTEVIARPPACAEQTLRQGAEERAKAMEAEDLASLSPDEVRTLLHELRVHKIGLETQNEELRVHQIGLETQSEELRRAMKELETVRSHYFDLYDLAPVGYLSLGEDGLILEANLTAAAQLGVPRNALVGQALHRLIVAEDQDIYCRQREQLWEKGVPPDCELRITRRDGTSFWTRLEARLALDGQWGSPVCRVTMDDITEHKRAANILQARLRLMEFSVTHSLAELLVATIDEAEELTGSRIGFYHFLEADQKTLMRQAWSTRTTQEMCQAEGQGRHYDIAEAGIWVDCIHQGRPVIHNDYAALSHRKGLPPGQASVIRDLTVPVGRGERMVAVLGVGNKPGDYDDADVATVSGLADLAWDIAERKQAAEALRASEERFRVAQEISLQAFAILRSVRNAEHQIVDFQVVYVNAMAARILKHPPDELVGRRLLDVLPGNRENHALFDRYVRIAETGQGDEVELEYQSEGISGWFRNMTVKLGDGVAISFSDITQHKRAEVALAEAKQAAEAASRAKSEFVANMSHEIRSPMTAILGFCDVLTTVDLPPQEQRDLVGLIRSSGEALLRLINDILDLSRIEAGRLDLAPSACPLQSIIAGAMTVVGARAQEKGLHLEVIYKHPLPEWIQTDAARLRQVLVNLLVNAVKFTDRGEVCLTVRYLQCADHPPQMQFVVADTGLGIAPDTLGKLFQPFEQGDATLTRRYGGTGLGLAISRRIAVMLGGDIKVTSELGRGSTFTLTIDPGPLPDPHTPSVSQAKPTVGERTLSGGSVPTLQGRVLFAEDIPSIQVAVRYLLRRWSLTPDVAGDGREACELAERSHAEGQPYDLILMDIEMPVMSGFDATRRLRQQGWRGPIVALTAYAMTGDREKCLHAGCDDYLAKPISMPALREVLERYLVRE